MAHSEHFDQAITAPADGKQEQNVSTRPSLRVLDALLNVEGDATSLAMLFRALRDVFAFDQAMVLQIDGERWCCVAAEPGELSGREWSNEPLLQDVARGRVLAIGGGQPNADRDRIPAGLVEPDEPALLLPIALREHPAALILRRSAGQPDFNDDQVVAARQCAVIALAMIAMRSSERLHGEAEEMRRLADELWQAEQKAAQDRDLFKEIIDLLPTSLTVQDEEGRFVLVNAVAAANLATPAEALIGRSPP